MGPSSPPPNHPEPPGTWRPARRVVRRMLAPVERLLAIEASSGVALLVTAVVALAWANSPWRAIYEHLLHTPIGFRAGGLAFERDAHFWINDGLMTFFFLLAGLEIRREMYHGELSELRRAALPMVAALGGMVAPALVYLGFNRGHPSASGWGVPMATDIAFAVGILTLHGARVAPALRIWLLALAVIDDVGAIVVLALFYSAGLSAGGLVWTAAGLAAIVSLRALGARSPWAYVAPGGLLWVGALRCGIHPALTGVALGLLTPPQAWYGREHFLSITEQLGQRLRLSTDEHETKVLLAEMSHARREAISPIERLQDALLRWVAYGVMPLFALANAGVPLGDASLEGDGLRVFLGVSLGLLLGKPLGIVGASWLASRAGWVALPRGVSWGPASVVGLVGGVGFTMALFIAQLAFPPGPLLETAKLAILVGSAGAAALGLVAGRWLLGAGPGAGAAQTDEEAEQSTSL